MNAPELDEMLDLDKAAEWLGLSTERLMDKTRGRNPRVPAFKLNQRVIRFHPRTIIAKFATDAGVPMEVVAASFGIRLEKGVQP